MGAGVRGALFPQYMINALRGRGNFLLTMKKILLCLLALAAGLAAFGQNESSFGVRAGLNVTNLRLSEGGLSMSLDSRASYHVGFVYQQPMLRMLPLYFDCLLYTSDAADD